MRLKLFLLLLLSATLPIMAQNTGLSGTVVDASTGTPIAGASIMLENQGIFATTGPSGDFRISTATAGNDRIQIVAYGYQDIINPVTITTGAISDLGTMKMNTSLLEGNIFQDDQDFLFDQSDLDDDEGVNQSISTLTGASDNVYYDVASYDFQPMYYRMRGYNSEYEMTYINGVNFNDLGRGRFSYSMLGGMNRAFRNKTISYAMGATDFGFGDIGTSTNINALASNHAPGFNGSISYTNSSYMLRALATYSTGVNKHGWALTLSAIGRYSKEGVVPGTFYNSAGLFIGVEKIFNDQHSLALTLFGAPTQRATGSPTYEEAYELADDNLYNPNWGWQDGKKRSARITETFDPTAIINWIWTPKQGTKINTAAAVRFSHYSRSALNWYNAADPRPDYYRYLPSYYKDDQAAYDYYTDLWRTDESMRQIDWDKLYQVNYQNSLQNENPNAPYQRGSTYILENRVSRQINLLLNSTVNHRLNDVMTLQGGVSLNYTKASYYKTIRDLLGGEYWLDIDQFSERDFPDNTDLLQNDLDNPNRKVHEGDKFGYNYDVHAVNVHAWLQNMINLPQWDINYGLKVGFTQFYRDGKMRNGRAPENSLGKGVTHKFDNAAIKVGATYKIDGRNFFSFHGMYETRAPLFEYAYVSPRIKDDAISGLSSERILSGDISYNWAYRRFRGSITAFWTNLYDQTERFSYYDDQYSTFMNYVLKNVNKTHKGIEIGMAYKITPSLTATLAGSYARYQYKNRPTGVRSYENGMMPDTATTVYLKNFFVGGTPQSAVNLGIDWAAPNMWFFNVNASLMGDAYVSISPIRHEEMPEIWAQYNSPEELAAKLDEIGTQEKLNDAFVVNASVGKVIYLNRRVSLNLNVSATNILNNRKIQTNGFQQGRFDYTNYNMDKYPNKYSYAQGIRIFANVGVKF